MEVDEIQRQVSKFQRVSSNGSTTSTDTSSNPQKIATNLELQNHDGGGAAAGASGGVGGAGGIDVAFGSGGGGGGVARLCGWPSSRIVRVSRASGGKDRHSKVLTSKGLRDRRVRLSVSTAIQFYDLQDRLGYDQPSKAVEWLLKAAASSIDELPSLDPPFTSAISEHQHIVREKRQQQAGDNKSPACSSTSETSKGSGLSLSRSENRIKARERARQLANSKKDKEIDSTSRGVTVLNHHHNQLNNNNSMTENAASFTDLLTRSPMDYLFTRPPQPSHQLIQVPQFNITSTGGGGDHNNNNNNNRNHHHFSFLQDHNSFVPTTGGGESYDLNFGMTSATTTTGGFSSRGTLQSNNNSPASLLQHHHHLQRFQSSSVVDGSTPSNLPFFMVPNSTVDHYQAATGGGYHLSYGGDDGGRRSDHHKDKSKN